MPSIPAQDEFVLRAPCGFAHRAAGGARDANSSHGGVQPSLQTRLRALARVQRARVAPSFESPSMKSKRSILHAGLLGLLVCTAWHSALAATALTTELEAARITQDNGREVQQPAAAVRPGDTLQYRARLHNRSRATLVNVVATLPVPQGTHFIAGSALPAEGASASLDGETFAPVPLMRRVRASDGQWRDLAVPLSEYRALRWTPRSLAADEAFTPSVRVRVVDTP